MRPTEESTFTEQGSVADSSVILPQVPVGTTWAAVPHENMISSHRAVLLANTGAGHTLTSARVLMCQENRGLGLLSGQSALGLISDDLPPGAKIWKATWRNLSSEKLVCGCVPRWYGTI